MSRGKKGFLAGLALLGLSLMLVVAGAASALTTGAAVDNKAPGPVSGLATTVDLAAPSVTLTWVKSSDDFVRQVPASGDFTSGGVFVNTNDVSGYQIWRAVLGGTATLIHTAAAGATTYTDATVQSGSTYTYQVKAVDAAGNASTAVTSESVSLGPPPQASITAPAGTVADTVKFAEVSADEVGTRKFIIRNTATATNAGALRVTVAVTGTGFAANKATMTIARSGVDTLTISFDAAQANNANGIHTGTLAISTNDPTKLVTNYQLTATIIGGLAPPTLDLSGTVIGFSLVNVDSTSTQHLTIKNKGGFELTGALALSGMSQFTISATSFALPAGDSLEVAIRFTPVDTVLYEGVITVTSNDPTKPEAVVTLSGRGSSGHRQLVDPATGQPIYGDLDGNAEITFDDFFAFADAFGGTPGAANWNPAADFNGDGVINFDDFFVFADNFGKTGVY